MIFEVHYESPCGNIRLELFKEFRPVPIITGGGASGVLMMGMKGMEGLILSNIKRGGGGAGNIVEAYNIGPGSGVPEIKVISFLGENGL